MTLLFTTIFGFLKCAIKIIRTPITIRSLKCRLLTIKTSISSTLNTSNSLGFNIRGVRDIPHFKEDTGIFVTRLKEAYRDGRLKEGDKILEVNGHKIQSVTHNEAVQIFITAGETVTLKVQHGAEESILKQLEARKGVSGGSIILLLLLGLDVAAGIDFVVMSNKK